MIPNSFGLVWTYNGVIASKISSPITFPGVTTSPQVISLRSSAIDLNAFQTLIGLKLYLMGQDADEIQRVWPTLAASGGLEISFDGGSTWNRFTTTFGLVSDSTTWITVPALSIGQQGQDGVLGPYDVAYFSVRFVIPPGINAYKVYDVMLTADFDILAASPAA